MSENAPATLSDLLGEPAFYCTVQTGLKSPTSATQIAGTTGTELTLGKVLPASTLHQFLHLFYFLI